MFFFQAASKNETVYLVFEFCEHDLAGVLNNKALIFFLGEIKKIIKQILVFHPLQQDSSET